ncbi:erythroblast NAD(P)(+)--arginine ADP-ribosyltransferase-like [Seriola dumerili]|uniref:erythroblast NAD(P)(+)--arginine ADP-ribosyltransferase-like n=1 Tax=Seriola dumerili TaxID=41447 RepID=UPI000BBEE792|nr:erythroblast NAD(P)(+)--arginine ADP-ribosyltransferase-like [Seriola dumerili]
MSPEHMLRTRCLIKAFDLRGSLSAQHLLILKTVMKGNMLIFAPLCLLLCWEVPVDSMRIHVNFTLRDANLKIPLSMVDHSVDDMYFGCNKEMMDRLNNEFSPEKYEGQFADVWNNAKHCAKSKLIHGDDKALSKDHIQAICAYTSDYKMFYQTFNDAVRTEGNFYGNSSFKFHSLHFLLTSAIQILNNNYNCHTTYRRTNVKFTGQINQRIRFGHFASSSYRQDLTQFGTETCFKIKTCSGALLKNYSVFQNEAEVLIPPYEVFKITKKIEGQAKVYISLGVKSCKVMYILESAGHMSTLNCKAAHLSPF